jgi:hypothetical protein
MQITATERLGKRFTQIVNKEQLRVQLQTHTAIIEGDFHHRADERLLDALNLGEPFIAITDATIKPDNPAQPTRHVDFVAVPRESISWIAPVNNENGGAK